MAFFLTGKGRLGPSFRNKIDTGCVNDLLEKRIPDEKVREHDQVNRFILYQIGTCSDAFGACAKRSWKFFSTGK